MIIPSYLVDLLRKWCGKSITFKTFLIFKFVICRIIFLVNTQISQEKHGKNKFM